MPSLAMVFDILAVDRASGVFARVGGAAAASAREVEASSSKMSTAMASFAKGAGLVGAAAAVVSVKMAADFQQQTNILVTAAGESQKALGHVRKGILDIATETGTGWKSLTDGMYQVEKAGYRDADALKILRAASQAAREEGANLATVTNATTSVMASYHLGANDAVSVTNQLKAAAGESKTTMELFAGSLSSVLPIASANKIAFADVAGALATLTQHGTTADQATQELAFAIRNLAAPNNVAVQTMNQLGISSTDVAQKLGDGPGGRGLVGTLKYLSETVLSKMGPAGLVLLNSFKVSATAASDMQTMLSVMPPKVRALAKEYADGAISVGDYRKAYKDLPTDQASMAQQFAVLASRSNGFNDQLRRGGPAAATYSDQMKKIMGGANGLNVVLQVTGESLAGTEDRIKRVADAGKNAGKDVQGWASTQNLLNVQFDRFVQTLSKGAIEAGTHLLPALTATFRWMTDTGLPAIGKLGSGIGDVAHWFSELPGPVKAAAEALAGLALANAIGLFTKLGNGITYARVLFSEFGDVVRASMGKASAAFAEAKAASAFMQTLDGGAATRFTGSLAGMGAAAGAAAKGGLASLKSAGAGLLSMLGGPWVVGIGAAVAGVLLIKNSIDKHNAAVKADTETVSLWYKAMASGGQPAIDASSKLRGKQAELAAAQAKLNDLQAAAPGIAQDAARGAAGYAQVINLQKQKVADLTAEVKTGKKEFDDYWNALSPQAKIAQIVSADEANLALALQKHAAGSREVTAAAGQYNADLEKQKQLSVALTGAEQTQIDKMNQLAASQLAGVSSSLAATQAQSQLSDAIGQYNTDAHDGQHSTKQLADESNSLAQQAISTAQAVGKATADQLAANGVTDDGTAANAAILKSLQDAAKHIQGPGHDALVKAIKDMGNVSAAAGNVHDAVGKMGIHIDKTWNDSTVVVDKLTGQQITDLHNLGYATKTLPNGKIVVTSDTKPATDEINKMLAYYRHQALNLKATFDGGGNGGSGTGKMAYHVASGGHIRGPGTGTSDSIPAMLSDGEFVINAAATQANLSLLHAINSGAVKTFAAGGLASGPMMNVGTASLATHMDTSGVGGQLAKWIAAVKAAMAPAYNIGGGAEQWRGVVDAVLRTLGRPLALDNGILSLIQHESGGNPRAINLTDSNARAGHPSQGLMQTIPSTFYAYAGPYAGRGITDPFANVYAGTSYAISRYGTGMLMAGGRHVGGAYVGYDKGTNYVPNDGPAYLHRGEAVIPASKNQGAPYQSPVFNVRVFVGDREITDIARVEAKAVVNSRLEDLHRKKTYR